MHGLSCTSHAYICMTGSTLSAIRIYTITTELEAADRTVGALPSRIHISNGITTTPGFGTRGGSAGSQLLCAEPITHI